jgi:serine/threonine-protein kinase
MIGEKILIIEDQPTWQRHISRALKGYSLHTAPSVSEAKRMLDQALAEYAPFQVMTLDINLKAPEEYDTSGEELLQYTKQRHPYIKCVVVSGTANFEQASNYFSKFGIVGGFAKNSFDPSRFREFIDTLFYVGPYRLLQELGRGGMAVVYHAQNATGQDIALKVLRFPDNLNLDKSRWINRFRQEAQIIQGLKHDHIVTMYDYFLNDSDQPPSYIAIEYLPGPTLAQLLKKEGSLPIERVIEIGIQLFDALAYAHDHRIVHRDVKPSNLIFGENNTLKITDFGIAKIMDDSQGLTLPQEILGTFGYMPPEQVYKNSTIDHRADIYAAGVVLHEALTGSLPYNYSLFLSPPKPLPGNSLIHKNLEEIIFKALAVDPENRPQSARLVHDWLVNL